jgi:hypothetical protein
LEDQKRKKKEKKGRRKGLKKLIVLAVEILGDGVGRFVRLDAN